jgi:hypothetical protein
MPNDRGAKRRGAFVLAGAAVLAAPAGSVAPGSLGALSQLERGRWRVVDSGGSELHSVCIGDPMQLVRLEHRSKSGCSEEVISSDRAGGTVQYSCSGRGFGHTSIRVETPRLARIDTQGLVGGRPFAYRAEARRVGACGTSAPRSKAGKTISR